MSGAEWGHTPAWADAPEGGPAPGPAAAPAGVSRDLAAVPGPLFTPAWPSSPAAGAAGPGGAAAGPRAWVFPARPGTALAGLLRGLEAFARPLSWAARSFAPALAAALTLPPPEGCGCLSYAAWMDSIGVGGCRARREEIVAHLMAQARGRGLDCPGWVASGLLSWAIRDAVKEARAATYREAERAAREARDSMGGAAPG